MYLTIRLLGQRSVANLSVATARVALEISVPARASARQTLSPSVGSSCGNGCDDTGDDQFLFHDVGLVIGMPDGLV
jgi:hypothetical protein